MSIHYAKRVFITRINQKTGTVYNRGKNIMKTLKPVPTISTIDKLIKFVNQRPGLDFQDYGDISAYRSESAEITRDRADFFELLSLASRRINNLDTVITEYLKSNSGRLTMDENGNLQYCTGQYFPTEYRPACNRVLANLIWKDYSNEIESNSPNPVYKDGHEIRKAIKRNVSRRVAKNYFN